MAEEQAAHHLLNVLEERILDVDLDKILLGFEDDGIKKQAAAWVEEYLHEETLLTKEELDLYQALKKKNLLRQYESEGEPVRPILDHELASAIASLQTSTAAIEEQSKILEAQKTALSQLKALAKPDPQVEYARIERLRKEGQEKARLDVAVDDISMTLEEQLADSQREVDTAKASVKMYLEERLTSDDQVLSRLPGIASQISTKLPVTEDEKSVEQWCKAIASFRAAEIKARVDATYLKILDEPSPFELQNVPARELQHRKATIQAEMQDLYTEIASVTEMVVEHEIRNPLKEMKQRRDRDKTRTHTTWLNYVLSTLEYMTKRLDTVTHSADDIDHLRQALAQISEAAIERTSQAHNTSETPARQRAPSGTLAFTPMVKLNPRKVLDIPAALQEALRHSGVAYNQDSIEALQDVLVQTQLERQQKLQDQLTSTSVSNHEKLAEHSSKADGDTRAILGALYKYTPFQEVSLTDPQLEVQLHSLEKELEARSHDLEQAEGSQLSLSDPKVKAFVAKYGK